MHELSKGFLIALEGIDGSGKSTLAQLIAHQLAQDQYRVCLTKEPGDSPLGALLRTIVQEKKVPISSKAEFLLFAADRAQHIEQVIMPALAEKKIIISDRLADSSLAYQGYGRGLDLNLIKTVNTWAMNGIEPDLVVYVKVSPALAFARIAKRQESLTSFEKEKKSFFAKLTAGFDQIFKTRTNVIHLDGTQTPAQLCEQAIQEIKKLINAQQS
jgi:dTMP kinase